MAHYVAELINTAEAAVGEACADARAQCAKAILELWAHRSSFPTAHRPLQEIHSVINTLEALDPDARSPFYGRQVRNKVANEAEESDEAKQWLSLAKEFDATARMLVNHAIERAAQRSINRSSDWVLAAARAGRGSDFDVQIAIELVHKLGESRRLDEARIKSLDDRLQRLDAFLTVAAIYRDELAEELKQAQAALTAAGSDGNDVEDGCTPEN